MRAGIYFSTVLIIWITGLLVAVYLFMPAISQSITSINSLQPTVIDSTDSTTEKTAIEYTPLAILEYLK